MEQRTGNEYVRPYGISCDGLMFIPSMEQYIGVELEIARVSGNGYRVRVAETGDPLQYTFNDLMIKPPDGEVDPGFDADTFSSMLLG